MKTINAEELKDYINHLIDKRKKIGTPDYDVYTILGYVVQNMEDEPEKGLDEQIEKIASDIAPKYPDISCDDCYDKIVEGIKAGMRLQASRGYTFKYKIKAEIEKRIDEWQAILDKGNAVNPQSVNEVICEDKNILSLILSLEKEKNVNDAHPSAIKSRFLNSDKERKIIREMYKDRFDGITPNRVKYLTFFKQVELDGRFSELNDLLKRYGK